MKRIELDCGIIEGLRDSVLRHVALRDAAQKNELLASQGEENLLRTYLVALSLNVAFIIILYYTSSANLVLKY